MNKPAIICTCLGFIAGACVVRIIDDNKLHRLEEFESQVKKQIDKKNDVDYIDISYASADGENDVRDDDFKSEDFLGEIANQSWSEIDRERVSEFLQSEEYVDLSVEDFAEDSTVASGDLKLQLVDETHNGMLLGNEIDINVGINENDVKDCTDDKTSENNIVETSTTVTESIKTHSIKEISPIDFVKAISNGSQMRSFIFDVMTGKLYWNFTDEPLSDDEVELYVGFDLLLDIVNESLSNNKKWVEPKYLYDSRDNTYTKIEAGGVIR